MAQAIINKANAGSLHLALPSILENDPTNKEQGPEQNIPLVNVYESDERYRIEMIAPGLDEDDFKIKADNGVLDITADEKQKIETNVIYHNRERNCHSFHRLFKLPKDAVSDEITAYYQHGMLHLSIPKNGAGIQHNRLVHRRNAFLHKKTNVIS